MKKLLLILLCLPMIGFGQNIIAYPDNGNIGDTISVFISGNQSDFIDSLNNPLALTFGADCSGMWYPDCGFGLQNNINNWQYDSLLGLFGFYSTFVIPITTAGGGFTTCLPAMSYSLMTFDSQGLGVDTPPFGFSFTANPFLGCMDPIAINYEACAGIDNGSCIYVTTELSEITTNKSKLYKITDLLGQETKPKTNTPLIEIYDDGTVEKRIVIE